MARLTSVIAALAAIAVLAGCGSSSGTPLQQNASLVLDFTPNAIHAGIYSAIARGFDDGEGVHLHVIAPTASTDSTKLLTTGRADFAILDIHDLALARERGKDLVGVMAIVERPLASVIAAPAIRSPRQLQGQTVGVTGAPSDTAVLDSVVSGAGGDPRQVKTVTIGFNAVAALLSGRVKAATAFWNDEGVTLRRQRPGYHVFRVDSYGAPAYPELVLCATRATIDENPSLVHGVVRALVRGYGVTLTDPEGSEANLESKVPGLDSKLVNAELSAVEPSLQTNGGQFGALVPSVLRAWARWELRFGIVRRLPDVSRAFDDQFVAGTEGLIGS
ncbi:MAG TPA: ABC transporter substrate-binding protein [Solirubrobacteraceae bacterium]|jgi:NitT/TauT family transport system substrate-binding protein/putative hydroxymethylpyrimidine transport system substrate-binding protein